MQGDQYRYDGEDQEEAHGQSHGFRERGGLIPITAAILQKSQVTKEETIEFEGVPISDVKIAGFVTEYKELEHRVKIKVWDFTGAIEVNFFHKQEGQDNSGLSNFYYDSTKKPVEIFGTLKVYKNEKNFQGAKLLMSTTNKVLYHRAYVFHSWAYLTGKLNELSNTAYNSNLEEMKNIANFQPGAKKGIKKDMQKDLTDQAATILAQFKNSHGADISAAQLNNELNKITNDVRSLITKLVDASILCEANEDQYEIL